MSMFEIYLVNASVEVGSHWTHLVILFSVKLSYLHILYFHPPHWIPVPGLPTINWRMRWERTRIRWNGTRSRSWCIISRVRMIWGIRLSPNNNHISSVAPKNLSLQSYLLLLPLYKWKLLLLNHRKTLLWEVINLDTTYWYLLVS